MTSGGNSITQDQLRSVVASGTETLSYYPYGEQRTGTATNDREKFATYLREENTRLDYAQQRYYSSTWGRFTSADPYTMSGGMGNPQGWNRYAYVENDPVNANDSSGLMADPCYGEPLTENSPCWQMKRNTERINSVWSGGAFDPYSGMPQALQAALQQYDNMVQNSYSIASAIDALKVTVPDGASYQDTVDAYLKELGLWDIVSKGKMEWNGKGYFVATTEELQDFLKANPLFASGMLGLFHVTGDSGVGWPNTDYRSWTSASASNSLQVTVGDNRTWIDVDRFNPYDAVGWIAHAVVEVIPWP